MSQDINFSNIQHFKILSAEYQQDIKQGTTINSIVATKNASGNTVDTVNQTWPMTMDITLLFYPDGSFSQATVINQYYEKDEQVRLNGQATFFSLVQNRVTPTDTLNFDSGGNLISNTNQTSMQSYFGSDSTGYCYSRIITANTGLLTSVTDGTGCN